MATPRINSPLAIRRRNLKRAKLRAAAIRGTTTTKSSRPRRTKAQREQRVVISLELRGSERQVIAAMVKHAGPGTSVAQIIRKGLRWYARTLGVSRADAFTDVA